MNVEICYSIFTINIFFYDFQDNNMYESQTAIIENYDTQMLQLSAYELRFVYRTII